MSDDLKVPWSGRGSTYTEAEIAFIAQAMRDADPLTQGRYQTAFEEKVRLFTEARHAFAVSSGTAALHIAALLCRLKPGDEVIVPAHTFAASAIPFAAVGAAIRWADIDAETFVVTRETIERVLTAKTKAVVVVHLYGLMADMDPIMDLARENGLLVVEDAAQALGATLNGRQAGTIGDFGCFSFHTHKTLTTLGEGGMLTLSDDTLARHVPGLRHNGMRGFEDAEKGAEYWQPAMSNVDFDFEGVWPLNVCMNEVQCAAGLIQLERLGEMTETRRRRADRFIEAMAEFPEFHFQPEPDGRTNVRYCLPARYDPPRSNRTRDDVMARLFHHHRIKPVVQYYPLYRYAMFQRAGFGAGDCPETDRLFDNMVSFPFQPWMSDGQFDYMVEATRETARYLRD